MIIPKIKIDNLSPDTIKECLASIPENAIATVNWSKDYPSTPKVAFKIAHNGTSLFLQYIVEENEILAKTEEDNGAVWTDSCVEFFISFADSPYYYNAEFSCIGKMLLGYRKDKPNVVHGSQEVMQSVKRYSSLGSDNFLNKKGDFKWDLLAVIPASAFWANEILSFDGLVARANFYKCGDSLSEPHFLSWMPIKTEKPNFHTPQFFEEVIFEK